MASDLRRGLSSPIKHRLCRIQACSTTHAAYACMFNRLRHIQLASTLGQVIRLDFVSAQGQGPSMQRRISSCHLDPHRHGPCLDAILSCPILSLKNPFKRKSPETLVSARLPTLWHTYVPQGSSLRPQGPGVVESCPILSLKNPFQSKSPETLVSARSPMLWHTYVPHGSSLKPQGPGVVES